MIIILSLFGVGCASTPPDSTMSAPLSRVDLYAGKAAIAINQKQRPDNEQQAIEQALAAEQLQKFDKAIYAYIQALEFVPDNAQTLYRIARLHSLQGNNNIAIKAYKEALVIAPAMGNAHSELGVLAMSVREYKLAATHLNQAVKLDQLRLKNSLEKVGEYKFSALDQSSPIRAYNALAILDDLAGHHFRARIYFRLVLKFKPRSALLATNLGYSFYLSGHYNQAERYLKQAIEYSPKFKRAWTNLGLVYARKSQYNRAVMSFEQVMSPAQALNDLGYFLMLDAQYSKAIVLFRQAIDASPSYFEQANKNLKRAVLSDKALAKNGESVSRRIVYND